MKQVLLSSLVAATLALTAAGASAATSVEFSKNESQTIIQALKTNNPDMPPINSVRKTHLNELIEVVVNKAEVFYATKDGKTLMFGRMIQSDNGKKTNLTEQRIEELSSIDFKLFNLSDAIVRKVGNGKNKIVTFEDPNCGYCKKLQPELAKLNDVTIYTFIIPILGQPSKEVAKKIICSPNKATAWENYMRPNGVAPTLTDKELENCDASVLERNISFSQKHGITGTPNIFLENAKPFKGYVTADKINDALNQPKK